jgi:uncharacterized membrane protein
MMTDMTQKTFHTMAIASIVALIALGVAWEMWLAPLRLGGSWLVLKVLPLLIPLRGIIKRDVYTLQWSSMLILLYFAEGIVRATTEAGLSAILGWVEVVLTIVFFVTALCYLRPYKKASKQLAKQAIQKASRSYHE